MSIRFSMLLIAATLFSTLVSCNHGSNAKQADSMDRSRQTPSVDALWTELSKLPDPLDVQREPVAERKVNLWHEITVTLDELSSIEQISIDALYELEDQFHGTGKHEKHTRLLQLLTRFLYKVEDIPGGKRFPSLMDGGAVEDGWLWPLKRHDGRFVLLGKPIEPYTGYWPSAYDEYQYVKKHAKKR